MPGERTYRSSTLPSPDVAILRGLVRDVDLDRDRLVPFVRVFFCSLACDSDTANVPNTAKGNTKVLGICLAWSRQNAVVLNSGRTMSPVHTGLPYPSLALSIHEIEKSEGRVGSDHQCDLINVTRDQRFFRYKVPLGLMGP